MLKVIEAVLLQKYPQELVLKLLESYVELNEAYAANKFKTSELESGFFVECIRRIVDYELFGSFPPIGQPLNQLNDKELIRYENAKGDDSFRILIPRGLKAIYNLRNKRGVAHLAKVSPNVMDATYIIATCNWVLAELIRVSSDSCEAECQKLIDALVQRKLPMVFDNGSVQRVLLSKLSKKNQVLLLLYHNSCPQTDSSLQKNIEYSNFSRFRSTILKSLHKDRLIEYSSGVCEITPLGIESVEKMLSQQIKIPQQ